MRTRSTRSIVGVLRWPPLSAFAAIERVEVFIDVDVLVGHRESSQLSKRPPRVLAPVCAVDSDHRSQSSSDEPSLVDALTPGSQGDQEGRAGKGDGEHEQPGSDALGERGRPVAGPGVGDAPVGDALPAGEGASERGDEERPPSP